MTHEIRRRRGGGGHRQQDSDGVGLPTAHRDLRQAPPDYEDLHEEVHDGDAGSRLTRAKGTPKRVPKPSKRRKDKVVVQEEAEEEEEEEQERVQARRVPRRKARVVEAAQYTVAATDGFLAALTLQHCVLFFRDALATISVANSEPVHDEPFVMQALREQGQHRFLMQLVASASLFLMGWPALLGVFRFTLPNVQLLVGAHAFFADLGRVVGFPLFALAFFFGHCKAWPDMLVLRLIILIVVTVLVAIFLGVFLGNRCETSVKEGMSGLLSLICVVVIVARLWSSSSVAVPIYVSQSLPALPVGIVGPIGLAVQIISATIGTKGVLRLGKHRHAFSMLRVNAFHIGIGFGNLLMCITLRSLFRRTF